MNPLITVDARPRQQQQQQQNELLAINASWMRTGRLQDPTMANATTCT